MRCAQVLLVAVILSGGCDDQASGPGPGSAGLEIVATPGSTDTVDAVPAQAVVVELRDSTGQIVVGVVVRFSSLPVDTVPFQPSMFLAAEGSATFADFVADSTNARGRAAALVRFGRYTGQGRIRIVAPEFGFEELVTFTIRSGNVASLQVDPPDTTVFIGAGMQLRSRTSDRHGNLRDDVVAYAVAGQPLVSVAATGAVTAGNAPGRAAITATVGSIRDSIALSIVPRGTFLAVDASAPAGFVLADLDGSNWRKLAGPRLQEISLTDPVWAPDGSVVAFVDNPTSSVYRLAILRLDGTVEPVITAPVPDLGVQLSPTFAPDGQTLYFSGGNISSGLRTIWRVRRDGTGAQTLSPAATGGDFSPAADPGGHVVAFHTPQSQVQFLVVQARQVLPGGIPGVFAEYSPLQRLAVVTGEQVAVVNPDGSGFRIVTPPGRHYAQAASRSPNGEWLLVRGESTLELIRIDTGLRLPIAWSTTMTHPAWKPGS